MQEALVYSCVFISFSFIAIKRERNEPKKEKNAIVYSVAARRGIKWKCEKISVILNLFQDLRNFFTTSLAIAATPHARIKPSGAYTQNFFTRDVNHIPSPLEADLRTDGTK